MTADKRAIKNNVYNPYRIFPYAPFTEPLEVPGTAIDDDPCVCLVVNEKWIPYLLGAMEALRWRDAWKGTPEEVAAAVGNAENLLAMIASAAMCDPCCPETNDLLKKILSEVKSLKAVTVQNNNFNLSLLDDGDTYLSFAPDAPDTYYDLDTTDTAPEQQTNRTNALCLAVGSYVGKILQTELDTLEDEAGAIAAALTVIGLAVAPYGLLPGAALTLIGLGVGAFAGLKADMLEDDTGMKKVICCMYEGLKGQAISRETFAASVNNCGFSENPEATIASVINHYNQFDEYYRMFVSVLGQAKSAAVSGAAMGAEYDCECCDTDQLNAIEWGHNSSGYYPESEVEQVEAFKYRIYSEEFILNAGGTMNNRKGLAFQACGPAGFQISEWDAFELNGTPLSNPIDRSFIDIELNGTGYTVGAPGQPQLGIVTAYIFDSPPGIVPPDWYLEITIY